MGASGTTCGCRIVVLGLYRDLKARKLSHSVAFDAAAAVYRAHHPEVPKVDAHRAIKAWLAENL